MNIILSIKPKWAKLIYEGKKTIEWRKTEPVKLDAMSTIFIYETAPVCRVTGTVRYNGADAYDFNEQFLPTKVLSVFGCVSINDLVKYQGKLPCIYGWMIWNPQKFYIPLKLEEFGLKRPPQSWQYIEDEKTPF